MTKRTKEILDKLDEVYTTEYKCYLDHDSPWQLLIATILSAQCTDARVNIVTKDLFQKYTCPADFANADLKELNTKKNKSIRNEIFLDHLLPPFLVKFYCTLYFLDVK